MLCHYRIRAMKITPEDKIFSEFIRKRAIQRVGGCERCLTGKINYKQLQCSHFWGRGKRSVRWDEDNAAGLCAGCHMYLTAHPKLHYEWFKEYLGEEKFELLESRATRPAKPDLNLIRIYYRVRIEEMP